MWGLSSLINNYSENILVGYEIGQNTTFYGTKPLPPLGNLSVMIPYLGELWFMDIGDKPFGPGKETWGVYISMDQLAWVYRYEGGGLLDINIKSDGSIRFRQDVIPVTLPAWAGTYTTWIKEFGSDKWKLYYDLVISKVDGSIKVRDQIIREVTHDQMTNILSWKEPNWIKVTMNLKTKDQWGPNTPIEKYCFTGTLQTIGEDAGPLEFRGHIK